MLSDLGRIPLGIFSYSPVTREAPKISQWNAYRRFTGALAHLLADFYGNR